MNFPFFIAKKYFRSKKSQQSIHIISIISMVGVCVGTMGLIVVLSVFNGFEDLIVSLYNAFDPSIKIEAKEGKVFELDSALVARIKKVPGVAHLTYVIEENALVKYRDKQYIATIKGVSNDFSAMTGVDSLMYEGSFTLTHNDANYAIPGRVIADILGVNVADPFSLLDIYVPRRGTEVSLNPAEAFNNASIQPSGVFAIQQDFDAKYVIVPLRFAQQLLDYKQELTALEIGTKSQVDEEEVKASIQDILGNRFQVKTRIEQHDVLYKIMKSEKWAVFLILSLILIIATFNVISSMTMLIIDKKADIQTLQCLGANEQQIKQIFIIEGLFVSCTGAIAGLVLGLFICFMQMHFELIKLNGSFVVEAYPVSIHLQDVFLVLCTVLCIGYFAAWYPAKKIIKLH